MACEQLFKDKLKERGLRLTPQREIILSVLHEIEGMATADEVHERLSPTTTAIDISTVYRTLDLLRRFGIVSSVRGADGEHRYELVGVHGPHIHLVCQVCGRVIPLELDQARAFAEAVQGATGFQTDLAELNLTGLCPECAASKGTEL